MTDKEVDTSDIPPLNNNFFAAAQWRLPRSYIDLKDFHYAREFATYILKQRLHEKKTEIKQLVHLAFNTSLIVSYSRPFTWNYNSRKREKSLLGDHKHQVLDGEVEVELHDRILALRNKAYAHSDSSVHLLEGLDYSKDVVFTRLVETLDRSATANLKIITEKWIRYLKAEKSKLRESLKQHN